MSNYLAITIGPIYKTFQRVRKTRELWAASYIFSLLSKRMIEGIIDKDRDSLIVPYYSPDSVKGVGLYPDRIFCKETSKLTYDNLIGIRNTSLNSIAQEIATDNIGKKFIEEYFRVYIAAYTVSEGQNPLIIGNNILDTTELRDKWDSIERDNELFKFFRSVNKHKVSDKKWIDQHLSERDVYGEHRFESMVEIATRAIRDIDRATYKDLVKAYCYEGADEENKSSRIDEDESNFIIELKAALDKIKPNDSDFKNYHKYVCIVQADGDRVGAYIKAINRNHEEVLKKLSRALYEWGADTAKIVHDYAGVPIYVGGDDLLCIVPVVGRGKNVITLVTEVAQKFENKFKELPELLDDEKNPIKPTLSVGVSITYYKYPLYEAKAKALDLLYKAKKKRKTLALSLLKHSGSSFDVSLSLDDTNAVRNTFDQLSTSFEDQGNFTTSIIQHFREHEPVYRLLMNQPDRSSRIKNYLLNNLDQESVRDMVTATATMANSIFESAVGDKPTERSQNAIHEIYSSMRILKFLNGFDDEK